MCRLLSDELVTKPKHFLLLLQFQDLTKLTHFPLWKKKKRANGDLGGCEKKTRVQHIQPKKTPGVLGNSEVSLNSAKIDFFGGGEGRLGLYQWHI